MESFFKLLLATVLGGAIGMERQFRGQTAGFRTQLLVCLGACLFTISSIRVYEIYGLPADPSRIAAQVVVGIGFLGAGAILRYGTSYIRGLTTAASMWMVSAIGITIGFGEYLLAGFATFLVLTNLIILKNIANIFPVDHYANLTIRIRGSEGLNLKSIISGYKIKILGSRIKFTKDQNIVEQDFDIRYKDYNKLLEFFNAVKNMPEVIEVQIS